MAGNRPAARKEHPMTATTTLTASTTGPTATSAPATRSTTKQIRRTGAGAGLVSAVATSTTAAVASALDVSLKVGGQAIPVIGFAQVTFVAAIIGTVIAVVMSQRASRPRHTFVMTTLTLTALSIVPDVTADAHTATKLVLALTHLVAAAIVIPALASRLAD
jgi:peptidoglycan/LPS O-acetylase OafA/YrhL